MGLGGVGAVCGPDDIDDIDVGHVVELTRPRLAHCDNGQRHGVGLLPHSCASNGQPRLQGGIGEPSHALNDHRYVRERIGAGHVIGRDGQEPVAVGHAHGSRGGLDTRAFGPVIVAGAVGVEGRRNRLCQDDVHRRLIGSIHSMGRTQGGKVIGVADQEVPQRPGGAQNAQEPTTVLVALIGDLHLLG